MNHILTMKFMGFNMIQPVPTVERLWFTQKKAIEPAMARLEWGSHQPAPDTFHYHHDPLIFYIVKILWQSNSGEKKQCHKPRLGMVYHFIRPIKNGEFFWGGTGLFLFYHPLSTWSPKKSDLGNGLSGWWLYTHPSEKYDFVNWDDDIPNIWENKIDVPNHQPGLWFFYPSNFSHHGHQILPPVPPNFSQPSQAPRRILREGPPFAHPAPGEEAMPMKQSSWNDQAI